MYLGLHSGIDGKENGDFKKLAGLAWAKKGSFYGIVRLLIYSWGNARIMDSPNSNAGPK